MNSEPAFDFVQLAQAKRKDLQTLAKKHGIKANLSNSAIIDALRASLEAKATAPAPTPNISNTESGAVPAIEEVPMVPVPSTSEQPAAPGAASASMEDVQAIVPSTSPLQPLPTAAELPTTMALTRTPALRKSAPGSSPKSGSVDITFTFGNFPSFGAADLSQQKNMLAAETSAIITSDETLAADKAARLSMDVSSATTTSVPCNSHNASGTDTAQTPAPSVTSMFPDSVDKPSSFGNSSDEPAEAPSGASPLDSVTGQPNSMAAASAVTSSPRTRARLQQERAAAAKARRDASLLSKLPSSAPKGKPITNSNVARPLKPAAPMRRPTSSFAPPITTKYKARAMPDFDKIHKSQFAQKQSLDDYLAKRHADTPSTTNQQETAAAELPLNNHTPPVKSTKSRASVSFSVSTPCDKPSRPSLRPTTPFAHSNVPVSVMKPKAIAPSSTTTNTTSTAKPPSSTATASSSKAKPNPRPKFDLQASLARPMPWKTGGLKDRTNTVGGAQNTKKASKHPPPPLANLADLKKKRIGDNTVTVAAQ